MTRSSRVKQHTLTHSQTLRNSHSLRKAHIITHKNACTKNRLQKNTQAAQKHTETLTKTHGKRHVQTETIV